MMRKLGENERLEKKEGKKRRPTQPRSLPPLATSKTASSFSTLPRVIR